MRNTLRSAAPALVAVAAAALLTAGCASSGGSANAASSGSGGASPSAAGGATAVSTTVATTISATAPVSLGSTVTAVAGSSTSGSVDLQPGTAAPGSQVSVYGLNCKASTGTATSSAFTKAIPLSMLSNATGGVATVKSGLASGKYSVTVVCGGITDTGTLNVANPVDLQPSTAAPGSQVSVYGLDCTASTGTATSSAFTAKVSLSMLSDATGGVATVKPGLAAGKYSVTVVCGSITSTGTLTVS